MSMLCLLNHSAIRDLPLPHPPIQFRIIMGVQRTQDSGNFYEINIIIFLAIHGVFFSGL